MAASARQGSAKEEIDTAKKMSLSPGSKNRAATGTSTNTRETIESRRIACLPFLPFDGRSLKFCAVRFIVGIWPVRTAVYKPMIDLLRRNATANAACHPLLQRTQDIPAACLIALVVSASMIGVLQYVANSRYRLHSNLDSKR